MVHFLKTKKSVKIYEKSKQTIKIRTKWGTFTMRAYVLLFKNQKKRKQNQSKKRNTILYTYDQHGRQTFLKIHEKEKKTTKLLEFIVNEVFAFYWATIICSIFSVVSDDERVSPMMIWNKVQTVKNFFKIFVPFLSLIWNTLYFYG